MYKYMLHWFEYYSCIISASTEAPVTHLLNTKQFYGQLWLVTRLFRLASVLAPKLQCNIGHILSFNQLPASMAQWPHVIHVCLDVGFSRKRVH